MVHIKNRIKKIVFSIQQYKKKATIILQHLGYKDFHLSILLTSNKTIQKYNARFRNKNKPTDILSFPFHIHAQPSKKISPQDEYERNLGDIIISLEYVYENKNNLGMTFEKRMNRMLVHGICHLLGYDHIEDKEYKIMWKKEKELLKIIEHIS